MHIYIYTKYSRRSRIFQAVSLSRTVNTTAKRSCTPIHSHWTFLGAYTHIQWIHSILLSFLCCVFCRSCVFHFHFAFFFSFWSSWIQDAMYERMGRKQPFREPFSMSAGKEKKKMKKNDRLLYLAQKAWKREPTTTLPSSLCCQRPKEQIRLWAICMGLCVLCVLCCECS